MIFELQGGRIEVGGNRDRSAVGDRYADGRAKRAEDAPREDDGAIVLLEHAELWLERGEHVSLVGPNGTGKTTLIETLAGQRELAAGRLSTGHNVQVGYLSQHADELGAGGHPGQSVLEAAARATGLTPNKARALLGRFLFSGEEAEKPLAGLSGGERRRLSLAVLVHSGANVLILDEPTNHLDIESREALEDALGSFPGAVLLVSHDRALLDAVGTRTVAIEDGALRSYEGGWPEYVRVREERRAAGEPVGGGGARSPAGAGRSANTGAAAGAGIGTQAGPHAEWLRRVLGANGRAPREPAAPPATRAQAQAQGQAEGALQEPPQRPAEGRARRRRRRGRRCARSKTSSPTRPRGRRSTRPPSPRPATPPPSAPSRRPTRGWKRWWRTRLRPGWTTASRTPATSRSCC